MPNGDFGCNLKQRSGLTSTYCPRKSSTIAVLHLLGDVLPDLGDSDACVRARTAQRLDNILSIRGLSWEAVAYLIARHGDRAAKASGRLLLGEES
jgi:hypothetical protein